MNERIKYALVFTGGMCLGAGIVGVNILKNEDFIEYIKRKVTDGIEKVLFEDNNSNFIELQCYSIEECYRIKNEMKQVIDKYGFVTVNDLYNIAELNKTERSFDYFNRGWIDVNDVEIISLKDCYILKLPIPMFIC